MTKRFETINQEVLTLQEAADFLRVSASLLDKEIQDGLLPALPFGAEWRILRDDFEEYLRSKSTRPTKISLQEMSPADINFIKGDVFEYRWPRKKGEVSQKKNERFTEVYVGSSGSKKIKIGFSDLPHRQQRTRGTVFIDNRPMVRFKPSDDFATSALILSIIKTADRKQLRTDDLVPPEYALMRVEPYRKYINSNHASRNMAVVCQKNDLQTMARHALIRASQIEKRKT